MTQRIEPFFEWQKMEFFWKTLRNELFWTLLEELNPFYYVFKNSTPFFKKKTPRIDPFFNTTQRFCSLNMTQIFFVLNMTQRTELFFRYDTKDWTYSLNAAQFNLFSMWFKKFFCKNDSELFTLFKKMTQELNFFWKTMIHGIEPFLLIWLTEWNPSFEYDSKNWTLFKILLKELNPFQHMTRRIEHFFNRTFSIWLKGFNFFNMFWRVEPFFDMT